MQSPFSPNTYQNVHATHNMETKPFWRILSLR